MTVKPLACKSIPNDAEIMPFPSEEVTPPVTNMYLAEEVMGSPKNTAAKVDYLGALKTLL